MSIQVKDDAKVGIGQLEFLVEVTPEKYGLGTPGYFEMLKGLSGQEMPYETLVQEHLKKFKTDDQGYGDHWNMGYYVDDKSNLVFRALLCQYMGARYGFFCLTNHESNHDVARIPLVIPEGGYIIEPEAEQDGRYRTKSPLPKAATLTLRERIRRWFT